MLLSQRAEAASLMLDAFKAQAIRDIPESKSMTAAERYHHVQQRITHLLQCELIRAVSTFDVSL